MPIRTIAAKMMGPHGIYIPLPLSAAFGQRRGVEAAQDTGLASAAGGAGTDV